VIHISEAAISPRFDIAFSYLGDQGVPKLRRMKFSNFRRAEKIGPGARLMPFSMASR
jgi:hypothetical protein